MADDEEIKYESLPWIYFKVQKQEYAISSEAISSIVLAPDRCEEIPQTHPAMLGVFVLRGEVIPLLSLRRLFEMRSLEDEENEMAEMFTARKNDHINWLSEFHAAIHEKRPFKLTDDPHKCAFGKWYDNYHTDERKITFHFSQLEEPHEELHALATAYANLPKDDDGTMALELLEKAEKEYAPRVISMLDDAIEIYHAASKAMVIVLKYCDRLLGLQVDSVQVVKPIGSSLDKVSKEDKKILNHYIEDLWQDDKLGLVRKMNYEKILEVLGC
ncbi:MAG: chemotaxis protein CheW [Oscillospiraceae bacterium]